MTDLIERPPDEVAPREGDDPADGPGDESRAVVARADVDVRGTTPPTPPPDSSAFGPATPDESRGSRHRRYDGRPESRPDKPIKRDTLVPMEDSVAERYITTQSPQRPQSTPRIRIEVDGRTVEGLEGQTILEVCRDNGIEIPTLCYEPKLPGFGACRMCVVDVEGEEHPPISCSRSCEDGMVVQTQTEELRRLRRTNLELIFSDHNAYCLPPCQNKCPSHIDIPGFLKQNAEGNFRESTRIFKRTIPFPSVLGRVCPAPCEEHCRRDEVDEAIAIRDSHRYAGDMVIKSMLDEDLDPPVPVRAAARDRAPRRRHRLGPRRAWPRPTTSCSPATTSPSSSATRRRAGCSATASRSTACRRSRSSRPSTRASPGSAARWSATRAWAATSPSTTSSTRASTRS